MPEEERKDPNKLYNPMSIKQLSEKYPGIPWKEYINTIFKLDTEIGEDEIVIVKTPSYFEEFEKLMEQTSKRTQANYAMWKAIYDFEDYLPEEIRKRELQFLAEVTCQKEFPRRPRWQECIEYTSNNFEIAINALYARKYLNKEGKKKATEMVIDILKAFQTILEKVRQS